MDLAELDLADMLHPDDITPERMWHAIYAMTKRPRRPIDDADYRGAERTARLLVEWCATDDDSILEAS
jgi:predicted glycosyltransferase